MDPPCRCSASRGYLLGLLYNVIFLVPERISRWFLFFSPYTHTHTHTCRL